MLRRVSSSGCLALALLLTFSATVSAAANYPADPFDYDRELMTAREIGTARGQTRVTVMGALTHGKASTDDIYFGGKGSVEFMLHEFGSVRLAAFQEVMERDGERLNSRATSLRVGPALHMNPYSRVDFGPYLEGGALIHNAFRKDASVGPEVAVGGFITIHIDSYWYLQLELERSFARVEINNDFRAMNRTAALLGLGLGF